MKKLIILLVLSGLLLSGCVGPKETNIADEEKEKIQNVTEKEVEVIKEYHYLLRENDTMFPHTEYDERYLSEKNGEKSKAEIIEQYNGMPPTCYITAEEYIDGKIVEDSIVKNRELFIYDLGYTEFDNTHYAKYLVFEDDKVYLGGIRDVKDNKIVSEPEFIFIEIEKSC